MLFILDMFFELESWFAYFEIQLFIESLQLDLFEVLLDFVQMDHAVRIQKEFAGLVADSLLETAVHFLEYAQNVFDVSLVIDICRNYDDRVQGFHQFTLNQVRVQILAFFLQ